jgi:hypothetical protein
LVQARPDENVIEHALLALQSPQGTALDQARRDGVQLTPALEATVSLDNSVQQIGHYSFFLACRCKAASDGGSCRLICQISQVSQLSASGCLPAIVMAGEPRSYPPEHSATGQSRPGRRPGCRPRGGLCRRTVQ